MDEGRDDDLLRAPTAEVVRGWRTSDQGSDRSSPPDHRALLPGGGERYVLGRERGRGGMGEVMVAWDGHLGRKVALKRLRPDAGGPELPRRFLLEAQVVAQLDHPNVVDVHDVGIDAQGRLYYTMQLVPGDETLRQVIDPLAEGEADHLRRYGLHRRVQVVQQLALALHHAHARGVVHRDVKPENVMLGPYGQVLLMDWGLAKVGPGPAAASEATVPDRVPPVTERFQSDPESVFGTPIYMAPEQLAGQVSPRTDVYSLAAVLFELLSTRHYLGDPARLDDVQALARAIRDRPRLPAP